MRRALWWLLWRQWVGPLRALRRQPFGSRGLALLLMLGFLALIAYAGRVTGEVSPVDAETLRFWAPWALLGLLALGGLAPRGLHFRAPDIAFLFAAPLHARELVLYNVLVAGRATLLSATWLTVLRGDPSLFSFVGITLTLLLLQLSNQTVAVIRAWFALRPSPWGRRFLPLALGSVGAVAATGAAVRPSA